jgi:hypothetical protein
MPKRMKWCCDGFRANYDQRHERGLIVYVLPSVAELSEPSFRIGFRAIERSKYSSLSEVLKGRMDGCLSLDCSAGMRFFPWCGSTLATFYRSTWQELLDERITDEFRLPVV